MDKLRKILCAIILLGFFMPTTTYAQIDKPRELVDFIIAVVGDKVILRSEFESEIEQIKESGEVITPEIRCLVFEELLQRKLLVHQGEMDSLPISDEQVEDEMNRRLKYFAGQMGGEKKLEEYLGKSMIEYKREMRPKMRQQLLARAMEGQVYGDIKVSPSEVKDYFYKIPSDSIPLISAEFEIGQIVIKPIASDVAKEYARRQLEDLRYNIVHRGLDFALAAKRNSDDTYSAQRGGSLGEFGRGDMVPAFERAVFKLQKDSISQIIETDFGFHIIKLVERRGEKVEALHILIRPKLTSFDIQDATNLADSIRNAFIHDSSSFCDLALKFSDDFMTKGSCGMLSDPQTGSVKIAVEYIDRELMRELSVLKPGELSYPKVIDLPDGSKGVRILYLKSEIAPHRASLRDDYPRIQFAALEAKRNETMQNWILKKVAKTYIYINKEYFDCEFIYNWEKINKSEQ